MRYWGKIAGVIIAFLTGTGLWGMLLGLFFGHLFDKARQHKRTARHASSAQQRQRLLFATTFEVMGHLAKIKGRVTNADINMATSCMQRMGLYGDARLAAQHAFRLGKSARYPLRNKLRQLRRACFGRFDYIRMFLDMQIEAAFANGCLHPDTQRLLYIVSEELGISRRQFAHYLQSHARGHTGYQHDYQQNRHYHYRHQHNYQQRYQHGYQQGYQHNYQHRYQHGQHQQNQQPARDNTAESLDAACLVLGVRLNNDAATIKRAYRKLMSKHHPDKLAGQGLSPAMMQSAKQKTQQIQHAYDVIKLAKGFR